MSLLKVKPPSLSTKALLSTMLKGRMNRNARMTKAGTPKDR
jgi:hypothetical protein